MKLKKNRVFWYAAGLVLLLLVWRGCGRRGKTGTRPVEAVRVEAVRGPLQITITGSGEIMSKNSQKIVPTIRRQATISFLVPEGSRVGKDEVIARLNSEELDNQIEALEESILKQESAVDSAETDLEISNLDAEVSLRSARQAVTDAEQDQEKFLQGDQPMEYRAAELEVQTAESQLGRSERKYEEMKELLDEGFVTEDEVEEARIALEEGRVKLETARLKLQNVKKYDHPLKTSTKQAVLDKARTELSKIEKTNATRLSNKTREIEGLKRQLERTREELAKAVKDRDALEIKAPTDGVVHYGDPEVPWRRQDIAVGATVHQGQVLLTIPDLSGLQAAVNIPEADIHAVSTGQTAVITMDALPGNTFEGVVTRVAEVANQNARWMGSSIKEFTVEIEIRGNPSLKPGYSCKAEIITETIADAVKIPVPAVFQEGDEYFVYLAGRMRSQRRIVKPGPASADYVQILEGLEPNETVYLSRPEEEPL
ncbi:MAG TPA: efflux RND transporter periplasmic adaptor subunit [Kiritimatiellia bacterium]|nr:efflux RND transporter periplasmic adaptor subunit [Kiritimatiellia bacterium]HNR93469.1 efflux RND transporter periplasmic adaptor subunit [Kiritimatiellia bacterium]HNS80200.1 efflux RND transporter periplasmic adaptor subunit [Kiritimatiellia bacterium]HPA78045.1 efflux RND transporter periplasmic adaptor subunit [Kiritimatiellia bacterium]HQQ04167.1 efflux RND transporter periplasmic adaptor subunit [Kiritimatiellia bacterium]